VVPGIFLYESRDEGERFMAIDEGVLVKTGFDVTLAVRNAIGSAGLGELQQTVEREFLNWTKRKAVRSALAKPRAVSSAVLWRSIVNKVPESRSPARSVDLAAEVGRKEARKLKARRYKPWSALAGFGLLGLVGWSVVLPTVLGVVLGMCIDRHYPDQHFWTLTFMVAGLVLGCWNAWHWIVREQREIEREQKENDHE
jgi:ATP synthase protein I